MGGKGQKKLALEAAYRALAGDRQMIQGLGAEVSLLMDENKTLRVENEKLQREGEALQSENARLRELVGVDSLTSLPNRYKIDEVVEAEVAYARRYGTPLSVLFLDIDHFKAVNDNHGHEFGDTVLIELTRRFRETLRDYDMIGRHGGEEFLGVLRNNTLEQASVAAERLRRAIAETPFEIDEQKLNITVSIGVAEWCRPEQPAQTIHAADMAMYRAKRAGRNRVVAIKR
ncbi:MAG: GGDEF domain-containing protein [Patescibacteria group bacterium]